MKTAKLGIALPENLIGNNYDNKQQWKGARRAMVREAQPSGFQDSKQENKVLNAQIT